MEAVYCNTIPLLPNRLSYPELFDKKENQNKFYQNIDDLICKLEKLLKNFNNEKNNDLHELAKKHDWKTRVIEYDNAFASLI